MDWKEYYKQRTVSAQEAAKHIKPGFKIGMGHAVMGATERIIQALADRHEELRDVMISHSLNYSKAPFLNYPESFYNNSMFGAAHFRPAINDGRGYSTARHFSQIPSYQRELNLDATLMIVSTPNKHGYVNVGLSIDYARNLIKSAKLSIVEANPNVPIIYGDTWVKVTDIDYFVESNDPLPVVVQGIPGELEKKIAANIVEYINDGDCLQLGIGGVPDAVLSFMVDKNDLGIHSEMISDGVMQLCKSGNINGKRKNFYPNLVVFTFAAGSTELYEWMDNNPLLLGLEVEYCNDSYTISQNDNMVAINGAVCVDLMGQVSADTIAGKNQSGVGGQVDFVRGANMSKGGRSFICMPSTAQGGKVSRIVPSMDSATQPVTTSYYDVDFVATEYGVAKLRGKTHTYRRDALIEIAAPEFRDWLRDEAKRLYKYVTSKTRIHNL